MFVKRHLKILHTSDIHLDNRVGPDDPGASGFSTVVDAALEHEVDLFLLAGDLFDHNRVKSHCTEFATEQLARVPCPVVLITGNHDCMAEYTIYDRYDPREAGNHIIFLQEEAGGLHRFDDLGVTIWGRGIVDHHPEHRPMEQVPGHEHEGWFLGMTHGHYVEKDHHEISASERRSSQITPIEIADSSLDYLALGHVHVFRTMQHGETLAVYPGSPNLSQGAKEMTAALVDLCPENGVSVQKLEFGGRA